MTESNLTRGTKILFFLVSVNLDVTTDSPLTWLVMALASELTPCIVYYIHDIACAAHGM